FFRDDQLELSQFAPERKLWFIEFGDQSIEDEINGRFEGWRHHGLAAEQLLKEIVDHLVAARGRQCALQACPCRAVLPQSEVLGCRNARLHDVEGFGPARTLFISESRLLLELFEPAVDHRK